MGALRPPPAPAPARRLAALVLSPLLLLTSDAFTSAPTNSPPIPPAGRRRLRLPAGRGGSSAVPRASRTSAEGGGARGGGGSGGGGRPRRREDDDSDFSPARPPPLESSRELSTFWRAVERRDRPPDGAAVPFDPNLDLDGPLPLGSYRTIGDGDGDGDGDGGAESDPRRMCLVTVSLDLAAGGAGRTLDRASARPSGRVSDVGTVDAAVAVRNVQRLIDSGFTSFRIDDSRAAAGGGGDDGGFGTLEWAEERVYGGLRGDTPPSVLRGCRLATTVRVPPADFVGFGSGSGIRRAVGEALGRMGGECVDAVQVPYRRGSPYHLDVLDALFDMRREGIVRSVSGLRFPPSLLTDAESCGFHLDTNQVMCNLLDPDPYDEALPACKSAGTKVVVAGTLAGGLLTDRFLRCSDEPGRPYLSRSERWHMGTSLRTWAERRRDDGGGGGNGNSNSGGGGGAAWRRFHGTVLGALGDASRRYRASAASVAIRWAMGLDGLGSVAVRSRVGDGDGAGDCRPYSRHRDLREAFAFELEEDDERMLWEVSGRRRRRRGVPFDDVSGHFEGGQFLGEGDDSFVPDLSDRKLWL